jgi:hypothetical protein
MDFRQTPRIRLGSLRLSHPSGSTGGLCLYCYMRRTHGSFHRVQWRINETSANGLVHFTSHGHYILLLIVIHILTIFL